MDYVDPTGLSPLQYLAKVKASFEDDSKYRILGKPDSVFLALVQAVPEDRYSMLRIRRVSMATNVQQKNATGLPADKKTASETTMRFYSSLMPDLNAVKTTATATKMARALFNATSEFQSAVDSYIAAAGTEPDAARDARFESTVKSLHDKLNILVITQKGRLRAENQFYNTNIVNASKKLAAVKAALDAFVPGTPAAAPAAATVPPAEGGGTLDVTV